MSTPYVGFGNDTLANLPPLKAGDEITCPTCGQQHAVKDSRPPSLLFYKCGDATYLAGIAGRNIVGTRSDCSGTVGLGDGA